jgi:hypothetical protein
MKAAGKAPAAEFEKLVKDLASADFATRDRAFNQFRKMPGALAFLRGRSDDRNLEVRRRIEMLVQELSPIEFRRRVREITKDKGETPIDLLVDLWVENKDAVEPEDWKHLRQIVSLITRKASDHHRVKLRLPDRDGPDAIEAYLRCPTILGKDLSARGPDFFSHRIIGERIDRAEEVSDCAAVLSTAFGADGCNGCILFVNGNSRISSAGKSFVYCDGDLSCKYLTGTLAIARGRVMAKETTNSIVIENARKSEDVRLFSAESLGLKLAVEGKRVRVGSIMRNSKAEECGLKIGDVIEAEPADVDPVGAFERALRKAFVKQTAMALRIRRGGEPMQIAVAFSD